MTQQDELCEEHQQILPALQGHNAVTDWPLFERRLHKIAEDVCAIPLTGKLPTYIPELRKADPAMFGMSVCSTTGQRCD